MTWGSGEVPLIVDRQNNPIASLAEATKDTMLARASLIMAAPELYDTTKIALTIFRSIAEHGDEHSSLAAQDLIPVLESVLAGANFLGDADGVITDQVLSSQF